MRKWGCSCRADQREGEWGGRNLLGHALAWRRTVRRTVAAGNGDQHRGWAAVTRMRAHDELHDANHPRVRIQSQCLLSHAVKTRDEERRTSTRPYHRHSTSCVLCQAGARPQQRTRKRTTARTVPTLESCRIKLKKRHKQTSCLSTKGVRPVGWKTSCLLRRWCVVGAGSRSFRQHG